MRPSTVLINTVLRWTIKTFDDDRDLIDADANPVVDVRKNGAATADIVTVTKRAATTGIYDCSIDLSGEAEGDLYQFEERADFSTETKHNDPWVCRVVEAERGTDDVGQTPLDANVVEVEGTDATDYFDALVTGLDVNVIEVEGTDASDYYSLLIANVASQAAIDESRAILDKFDTMVEQDGAVWDFTAAALAAAPAGGGGGSGNVTTIEGQPAIALLSSLATFSVLADSLNNVTDGGAEIEIVQGDAYLSGRGTAKQVSFDDPDQSLFNRLDNADAIKFGAGRSTYRDQLVASSVTATENAGTTTLAIEFESSATGAVEPGEYEYQIQLDEGGDLSTFSRGCSVVVRDRTE